MRLALQATSYQKEPTRLEAEVSTFDRSQRIRRAAAVGVPLFAGALLSVPIPGWHFVGVPGFLIACVVFARRRLAQQRAFSSAAGPCPACRTDQSIEIAPDAALPLTVRCPGCGEFVKLEDAVPVD